MDDIVKNLIDLKAYTLLIDNRNDQRLIKPSDNKL